MTKEIVIGSARDNLRKSIVSLLRSENLPSEDLPSTLDNFLVAWHENEVVGTIGLEQYGNFGLLRSLVVNRDCRNENIAGKLVRELETKARISAIHTIYLLTETASGYFQKKGYQEINRADIPNELRQSSEFSHICPQSAIVMNKIL